jgi:hypothetical protein
MALGVGRRTLYLYGLCGLCTMLMIMGFLGLVPESSRDAGSMATGSMMIAWALFYQLSVGTICYSLVSELSTRRLHIKTVVLGRNLYNIVAIVCNVLTPYMLNPSAWGWVRLSSNPITSSLDGTLTKLGKFCGFLLGRIGALLCRLHVFPCSRAARTLVCGARCLVREKGACPEVLHDLC